MTTIDVPTTLTLSYERMRDIRRGRDRQFVRAPDGSGIICRLSGAIYKAPALTDPAYIRTKYKELLGAKRPLSRKELRAALSNKQSLDAIEKAHATLQFGDLFNAELIPYAIDGTGKPIPSKKIRDELYFKLKATGQFFNKEKHLAYRGNVREITRNQLFHFAKRPNKLGAQHDGIYMGVELETGCKQENLKTLFYATAGFAEMKADGSLSPQGVEIATRPLPFRLLKKKWRQFYRTMEGGLEDESNGGVHIHISYPKKAEHVRNLFYLVHADVNYGLMTKIARRKQNDQYCHYGHSKTFYDSDRIHDSAGKYNAIAMRGRGGSSETLEFRIFKTTRQPHIMIQYLELVRAAVDYTKLRHSNETTLHWKLFGEYVARRKDNFPQLYKVVREYAQEQGVTL